jgi:hypothetical protein
MTNFENKWVGLKSLDQSKQVVAGVVLVLEGDRELDEDCPESAFLRYRVQPLPR